MINKMLKKPMLDKPMLDKPSDLPVGTQLSLMQIRLMATIGSSLEFFDFTLFILFSSYINVHFFPANTGVVGIIPVLLVFAIGYIARPLGGILLCHFSDRYGRKQVFLMSIVFMSLATFGISLLPSYKVIGISAPILLVVFRIVQGVSLGGELPSSVVYAAEHAPNDKRGSTTGLVIAGVTSGNVLGGLSGVLLQWSLPESDIEAWGWRIPFFVAGVLGVLGYYIRKELSETPIFKEAEHTEIVKFPIKTLLKEYPLNIIKGIGITLLSACSISVLFYLPRYCSVYLGYRDHSFYSLTSMAFMIICICSFMFGYLSDKYGRKTMLILGTVGVIVLVMPAFMVLKQSWSLGVMAILILVIPIGVFNSCYETALVELFPTKVRATGVAFCHNAAFGVLAGIIPMTLEKLCYHGYIFSLGFLIGACALLSMTATVFSQERYHESLAHIA